MTDRDTSRRPLRVLPSRERYEPVAAVDPVEVLHGVATLRLRTWRSRPPGDAPVDHLGPAAAEFHDRFGLGRGPDRVPAADVDGVALAAIQGLRTLIDRQARELDRQAARLADQRDDIEALREHVEALRGELARLR